MTSIRDLARELAELRELATGGQRVPQLAHSSIEDGALDSNVGGQLGAQFGLQYDGASMAVSLNGPTPPTPTAPTAVGGPGQAVVGWDGYFADDPMTVAPTDWSRAEIHASTDPGFAADTVATLRTTFESPRGGEKTVGLPPGTWYIKLVARSLPGKRSAASQSAMVVVSDFVTPEDIAIYEDRIQATETTLATAKQRLDSTESELDDLFGQVEAVPAAIGTAKQEAIDAAAAKDALVQQAAAADATQKADVARDLANQALSNAVNTVKDPSFETVPGPWPASGRFFQTTSQSRTGVRSLQASSQPTLSTQAVAYPMVAPAQKWRITGWYKTDAAYNGTPSNGKLRIGNQSGGLVAAVAFVTNLDWTKAETIVTVPAGVTQLQVTITADHTAGTIWFDDLEVTNITEALRLEGLADAAQTRANDAYALAGTANTTANSALTSANGKNRVYRSTAAPSGSGTTHGDVWFQFSSATYTVVIGQWTWDGTGSGAWQKNTLSHQTISSVDIGSLSVIGTGTFKTAVADEIFAKIVKARVVEATEAFIGNNAILTGAVTASKVNTEEFFAAQAVVDKLEGRMATYLTNEDGSGLRSTITGQGLAVTRRVYDGLELVDEQDLIRLGTFGPSYLSISDDAGEVAAAMGKDGGIVGRSIEARDRISLGGTDLETWLNSLPQPLVAWGQVPINSSMVSNSEVGLFEIGWESPSVDRMYQITVNPFLVSCTATNGVIGLRARFTTDGSAPTINSQLIGFCYQTPTVIGSTVTLDFSRLIGASNGPYIRVLFSLYDTSSGVATVYEGSGQTALFCSVVDMGKRPAHTASATTGGGTPYTASSTPLPTYTPPPAPKVTKTYTWEDTGVRSYLPNGSIYNFSPGKGYQGLQPYTSNGNLRSMWSFGTGIQSTLSGATIEDIWAYFYFEHWYYAAGGTARIRLHGNASLPSTYNGTGFGLNVAGWTKGSGRWVRLPDSTYDGFKSGQFRGIGLEGDSTYQTYGIANNAAIRVKYTK